MYFIEHLKLQFFSCIALYQQAPGEGLSAEVDEPIDVPDPGGDKGVELAGDAANLGEKFSERGGNIAGQAERIAAALGENSEGIEGVSGKDMFSYMEVSDGEKQGAISELGAEATPEQIQEYVYNQRLEALSSSTITDGEREVIESDFIAEVAEEHGVDAETLKTLKALGFEGAEGWSSEDTADNLTAMAESLAQMQEEMEKRGLDMPENQEDFLALYDYLMQTDEVDGPLTEDEAEALGIQTEVGPDGQVRIDPSTPGYTEMPNGAVVGPPGSPSSYNGNVYSGRPSEIAPGSEHVTYEGLTAFEGGAEMTDAEVAKLQGSPEQKERNKELIEARFPSQWYDIAIEFCNTEGTIDPEKPIAIASCPGLIAIVSYPGEPPKIEETRISIGKNGYGPNVVADHDRGSGGTGDRRTQTGRVQHFHSVSIAGAGNVVRGGGSMTGAIIESPEGQDRGGRWWHGGRDGRFPGQNSYGCVVATDEFMIRLANAVNTHGGGYGFQSTQGLGEERVREASEAPSD